MDNRCKGSDLTRTCAPLKVERRLLSRAQAGCSPHDMTAFEVLLELEAAVWTHRLVTKKERRQLQAFQHIPETEKVWYTAAEKPDTVCLSYLLALLLSSEHGKAVPHFQPNKVYQAMLGKKEAEAGVPRRRHKQQRMQIIGDGFDEFFPEALLKVPDAASKHWEKGSEEKR